MELRLLFYSDDLKSAFTPILNMCTTVPPGENEVAPIETLEKVYREIDFSAL